MTDRDMSDVKRELLARLLAGKAAPAARRVTPAAPGRRVRLSYAQERVWLTGQLAPDVPAFHLVMLAALPMRLEPGMIEERLRAVVARHDALRTAVEVEDGTPLMVVREPEGIPVRVPVTDLSDAPDPRAAAVAHAERAARAPYELERAPLWRAEVMWIGPETSMLLFTVHHLVADATSLDLIALELSGAATVEELPVTYRDFAAWQRDSIESGSLADELTFWRGELAGVPTSLELPADRPRPPVPDLSGRTLQFDIPAATTARVRELSKAEAVTPYVVHLAALGVLLSRYTHRDDVLVGTYVAGRGEPELQHLVGMFVNLVPIRVRMGGDPTFRELAARVRAATAGAFAHQTVPFEQLVRQAARGTSRGEPPLVQIGFNMLRLKSAAFGEAIDLPISQDVSQLDLTAHVVERADGSHNLMLEYATTLFDQETVEQLARHHLSLLERLTATPDLPLARTGTLPDAERGALTAHGESVGEADGSREHPPLTEEFAAQVRLRPEAVAVRAGEQELTYRELDARAALLADRLRAHGVGPETVVGVCLERGLPLVIGLLAIWRAGAAYLPLDPEHPPARWATMLTAASARLVLTDTAREPGIGALDGAVPLVLDGSGTLAKDPAPAKDPATDPASPAGPAPCAYRDGAAYVVFTSGSTGTPKGVVVTHGGIANRVGWTVRTHGLTATDRVLQKTRTGFDAACWEVFAPLVVGGTVVLAPPGTERDPAAMLRAVAESGTTVLQVVPSVLRLLVEEPGWERCGALRLLFSAGEPLDAALCRRVRELADVEVWNTYGPTECSIDVTAHPYEARQDTGTVPIGAPIDRTRTALVDARGDLVPDTVPGELLVGGAGVARGYAGRPDLTAERFVPDPYGPPGSRAYRTGDLVTRGRDGVLRFAGRADDQVKVNGVRIEPGEITAALLDHPEVGAAHVLAAPGPSGERRLVAYVVTVSGGTSEPGALRSWLAARLPAAMVPAVVVPLAALPLTENGKVDRAALPPAEAAASTAPAHLAPRTPEERLVAEVWSELLGVEQVGAGDDFFALGGHSLLLARLAARLTERAGTPVAVHALFGSLRLCDQAALLAPGGPRADVPPPVSRTPRPAPGEPGMPLSSGQRRLWFLDQLTPHSPEYVLPVPVPFTGSVELPALRAALGDLATRHEILRTRYVRHEGEPRQVVSPPGEDAACEVLDGPLETMVAALGERIRRGFTLAEGPCWRAVLLRGPHAPEEGEEGEPGRHASLADGPDGFAGDVLVLLLHHIAADGLSVPVLSRDLRELYRSRTGGGPAQLPELPVQYADFAAWQQARLSGERVARELEFWRDRLAGAPYLALPTDHPRPPVRDAAGAVVGFRVPAEVAAPLVAAGRRRGASEFMSLLAPFTVLLGRYCRQDDITVGVPVAGRARPELDDLVGFFVNTLVLRTDLSGAPTTGELLDRVRSGALDAFAHPYLPFERLVEELSPERDLSRTPLVSVLFDVTDAGPTGADGPAGGAVGAVPDERFAALWQAAKFDQTWTLRAEPDGSYVGTVEYATALFRPATVRRMTEHFVRVLRGAADPDVPVETLDLVPGAPAHAARPDGPRQDPEPLLPDRIAAHAAASPDATAVTGTAVTGAEAGPAGPRGHQSLGYRELLDRAHQLAHHLRARGVGEGDVLGVALPRGTDLLVGLLAAWHAGAAFLPLDLTHPAARVAAQCADADAVAVLTDGSLPDDLADAVRAATDRRGRPYPPVIDLAAEGAAVAARPTTAPPVRRSAADAAYVMFTSGSTGRPKGVVVEHGALANRVGWSVSGQGLGAADRILHKTRSGFDASVLELFLPLACGGTVVMAPPGAETDPGALLRAVADGGATVLQLVPSVLRMLLDVPVWPPLPTLRQVWLAGEPLTAELVAELRERVDVRVWNTYGPTECAVDVTAYPVGTERRTGALPIGSALPNVRLRVLDRAGGPAPDGVPGDLYVGGAAPARGYAGRPDLTAERFVPDPYGPPGARLYRTGDLVRVGADGTLEFAGRADDQVKVNGVRIEPGEVGAALAAHPSVREAVVVAREAGSGGRALVAYYLPEGAAPPPASAELTRHCRGLLPASLVPGAFVPLTAFPLNGNGKLDRSALPDPAAALGGEPGEWGEPEGTGASAEPEGPVEELVAKLCRELLGVSHIGARTSFFALGGNSLLAIRLISALQQEFDVDLPVRVVFEGPTVGELAAAVEAAVRAEVEALSDDELAAEADLLDAAPDEGRTGDGGAAYPRQARSE